ncbi:putative membrane protein YkoI [Isoptericola sp. CG 20/1183]|uniref:Membrane protein YkoI n=1 Tax=Isoptericola halotolerans TaxID=300560 RepID=A0ABX5EHR9_9MICO|nr:MULTISPECIES: hypothetical protein [Isoptericola]PRZ04159.1 putative membrane protein YkoI [Isoptericola sp. CG 20/1183]PRZ10016.1 putative membrane protein YkoI [Isoptericola halotolerans]
MTHRTARTAGLAAIALTLGLTLAACSDDAPDDASTDGSTAPAAPTDDAPATDAPADESDDAAEGDGAADASEGSGSGDEAAAEGIGDRTTTALAALATAESEAGGTAFAIDDDDAATSWEVDVAVDGGTVEVTVDGAGTEVLATAEDDLDSEDRDALDGATVGLAEAIQRVVGQSGGTLEDADLDADGSQARWSVSILTRDDVEEDHLVDLADGSVTQGG